MHNLWAQTTNANGAVPINKSMLKYKQIAKRQKVKREKKRKCEKKMQRENVLNHNVNI